MLKTKPDIKITKANVMAFAPDERSVAVAKQSGPVRIVDLESRETTKVFSEIAGGTFQLAYSPDGRQIALAYQESAVALLDVAAGKVRHECRAGEKEIAGLCFSPCGSELAYCSWDPEVLFFDSKTGKRTRRLLIDEAVQEDEFTWSARGKAIAFSHQGDRFAVSGDASREDDYHPVVRVWSYPGLDFQYEIAPGVDEMTTVKFGRHSDTLIVATEDDTSRLAIYRDGRPDGVIFECPYNCLDPLSEFDADKDGRIVCAQRNGLRFWGTDHTLAFELPVENRFNAISFSRHSRFAGGAYPNIQIWGIDSVL